MPIKVPRDAELLKRLHNEGKSVSQIGAMFGAGRCSAWRAIHDCGLNLDPIKRRSYPNDEKTLHRLYVKEKMSASQIVAMYGGHPMGTSCIRRRLKSLGIIRTQRDAIILHCTTRKIPRDRDVLEKLVKLGMSQKRIAAKFGATQTSVSHMMHALGVKPKGNTPKSFECRVCGEPRHVSAGGRICGARLCRKHLREDERKFRAYPGRVAARNRYYINGSNNPRNEKQWLRRADAYRRAIKRFMWGRDAQAPTPVRSK